MPPGHRNASWVASRHSCANVLGVTTGSAGGPACGMFAPERRLARQRNPDSRLAAASFSLRHLLLGYRGGVVTELLFELEVRTGAAVSDVLSHMRAPGSRCWVS
jgi:hypothetical protein